MSSARIRERTRTGRRGLRAALAGAAAVGLALAGALVTTSAAEAAPLACTSDLYGSALGNGTITKTDPSGAQTTIVTSPAGIPLNSLAYDPVDGNLYANTFPAGELYRIAADGTATDLGVTTGPGGSAALTIDSDGVAWAGGGTTLYRIDLSTLTQTSIPLSQSVGNGDFAFVGDKLYVMGVRSIASIDPSTGTVQVIPVAGNPIGSPSMVSFDGHLYVSTTQIIGQPKPDLLEVVGLDTGTASLVDTGFPWTASDGASCSTAPSPILAAIDDNTTGTPIDGAKGGTTASVLGNDLRGGSAVNAADITPTLTNDGGLTGATINPDGTITVPAGAAPGLYTLGYQICLTDRPQICDTATVSVLVAAATPAPTTTPTPTPTPAAGATPGSSATPSATDPSATATSAMAGTQLADTGSDSVPVALAGIGVLALGLALVVGRRMRLRASR